MKKLLLLFLLLPMVVQAEVVEMSEVPLVEVDGNGMKVYITTHQIEEEWGQGPMNCSVTTTYYKFGGKLSSGSAKVCNMAEYNCNYLGICPSSGGESNSDAILQAILEALEAQGHSHPWDKRRSRRGE